MTRQEEKQKAAEDYIKSEAVSIGNELLAYGDFLNGANWADKTMIDKACEWLKNNVEKYYYLDEAYDRVLSIKNLINDFKNYMKGE